MLECKAENNQELIDVYTYSDVYNEDFSNKFTLNVSDIQNALNGE